jgi:hypothetical protein
MTQGYFGFCRKHDLRIVGSWHSSSTMYALEVSSVLRQEPKCHVCAWSASTQAGSPSTMCALGLPSTQALAQAPHGFFFYSNNCFFKFINDDNNNSSSSSF